jgi:hypothetical protein
VALVLLKEGYSAAEAVNLIRDRRSANALCNPHFVRFIEEQYQASQLEGSSH